jgi:hypothetical protein
MLEYPYSTIESDTVSQVEAVPVDIRFCPSYSHVQLPGALKTALARDLVCSIYVAVRVKVSKPAGLFANLCCPSRHRSNAAAVMGREK